LKIDDSDDFIGADWYLAIFCCLDISQSSDFLSDVWSTAKAPYLKINTSQSNPAEQQQWEGGWGRAAFSCVIHRESFEKLPKYIQSHSVMDMIKMKLFHYIVKIAWVKLSIPF
jgi:hypothetical protein